MLAPTQWATATFSLRIESWAYWYRNSIQPQTNLIMGSRFQISTSSLVSYRPQSGIFWALCLPIVPTSGSITLGPLNPQAMMVLWKTPASARQVTLEEQLLQACIQSAWKRWRPGKQCPPPCTQPPLLARWWCMSMTAFLWNLADPVCRCDYRLGSSKGYTEV